MAVEKYPDPTWTNKIEYIDDKDYIDVKVTKVISVGDMHFIYLESTDKHVNMNLGAIFYTGELKSVVEKDAIARYTRDGNRIDFSGWKLQRDDDNKWNFQPNNIRQVVKQIQPEPQPVEEVKIVKKPKPKIKKENEDLYEVFRFYLDAFSTLCREDEEKMPAYKKAGIVTSATAKCNELHMLLSVVQTVLTKKFNDGRTKSTIIRNELIQNGVTKLRVYKVFVENMMMAWDRDVKGEIINKKGVFLHNPEESAILALEWVGFVPNTEKNIFNRINEIIKKRVFNNSVNDFTTAQFIRRRKTNNHSKIL